MASKMEWKDTAVSATWDDEQILFAAEAEFLAAVEEKGQPFAQCPAFVAGQEQLKGWE